jgi:tRNA U34 5-carboxymethylaminomethyl modifying enzyme MnmG/GidA
MKTAEQIRDLKNEEGMEVMLRCSYDSLANGGRDLRERIARRKIDPATAEAIRRVFGINSPALTRPGN